MAGTSSSPSDANKMASVDKSAIVNPFEFPKWIGWWIAASWNSTSMEFSSSEVKLRMIPVAFHNMNLQNANHVNRLVETALRIIDINKSPKNCVKLTYIPAVFHNFFVPLSKKGYF